MAARLNYSTLWELLHARAAEHPERLAYTFLHDGESEESVLTYGELDGRARAVAARLARVVAPGERALLLFQPGLDYIAAFFGCLYAGVIAVPAYPPRLNRSLLRLEAIVGDAEARAALTTASTLSKIQPLAARHPFLQSLNWLSTDDLAGSVAGDWREPGGSDIAFIQYTSGSTGTPKGAIVTHGNLLSNLENIQRRVECTHEGRALFWLPPYHDMGLIGGVLEPLYVGCSTVLMPASAFLQRPSRWLQAISRTRATHSGGPDFAYELCVRKVTEEQRAALDLNCWEVAFTGAEPVRSATLERFAAAFGPCGFRRDAFYPCYGLAEATLMVSGGSKAPPPVVESLRADALDNHRVVPASAGETDERRLVGCGTTLPGQKIVIVDPESLTPCTPDVVGEIWVSGPGVAAGYWNRPEETAQTFGGRVADTGEGPFLRTGDLGFLKGEELFVTGRLKDLIILRGLNHYPQDIEATVEGCHEALRLAGGAAFSVEAAGEERLVIVHEIDVRQRTEPGAVIEAVRRSVAEKHDLEVYAVVLVKAGSVSKTSSGKIQRRACRQAFLEGGLSVVKQWDFDAPCEQSPAPAGEAAPPAGVDEGPRRGPAAAEIQGWLVARLAERLKLPLADIDVRRPFTSYGLGSVEAVSLSGEVEAWLGRRLSPTLAYDYPTVEALARHLASEETEPAAAHTSAPATHGAAAATAEPIAIVGMGCRMPGAEDLDAFWRLLREGRDSIAEVPAERWDVQSFYDPRPDTPGKMNTRCGGFLERVDLFDPQFFGISAREALRMDPQQRLVLEVSWEALENAGIAPGSLAGSRTGVFLGISNSDYSWHQFARYSDIDIYASTGNAHSVAASRLSYVLDLRGPSMAVNTACSSSLVAVHLACQSLRAGECDAAIAGGVNLILTPHLTISFSQGHMMSGDGLCKTFDAEADGYVRGEGCGMVVVKRLSDALRNGDTVLAVIRGTAVNQDGLSNGLTAPSGVAQQAVIRAALKDACVNPAQVGYVEAHGTGTRLGDPIELNALAAALSEGRPPERPFRVGSVKTNIGHLEAAAGVAGLIKVVLSLQHGEIPPHLNLKKLNPHIQSEGAPFRIPTSLTPWGDETGPRLAGVSSFSFGGTNAHLILEEASAARTAPAAVAERPVHVLALSAKSEESLRALARRYEEFLSSHGEASLADVCFSANTGRTHFAHRLALVAESVAQMCERLAAFLSGAEAEGVFQGHAQARLLEVAFLFTGQGSQYFGMGRELYESQPTLRRALDRCEELLRPRLERPLLSVLYPEAEGSSPLHETAYTQPALFALEYALSELWRSWGVVPDAVMGHSVGEYAAACAAGVFSLEDGLKLVAERARLMQALPHEGEMAVVFTGEECVWPPLAGLDTVSIAAVNGPRNTVVSGTSPELRQLLERLSAEGIDSRPLSVSHAFHSPLMLPVVPEFERTAAQISYAAPRVRLVSNLTAQVAGEELTRVEYWREHILNPVRFAAGMQTLGGLQIKTFIEIGPRPILLEMGRQCLGEGGELWLPSLRKGAGDWQQILESLASLYVHGAEVDWKGFDRDYERTRLRVPTYAFQRQSYWLERPEPECAATATRRVAPAASSHALFGRKLRLPCAHEERFERVLDASALGALADYRVYGEALLPAACYVEMALAAATTRGGVQHVLEEFELCDPLLLTEETIRTVQVVLTPEGAGAAQFQVYSSADVEAEGDDAWTLHAAGRVRTAASDEVGARVWSLEAALERCEGELPAEVHYGRLRTRGLECGEDGEAVERLWAQEGQALALVSLPGPLLSEAESYSLHPILLDACFQLLSSALPEADGADAYLPQSFERLSFYGGAVTRVWGFARLREGNEPGGRVGDLCLFDDDGRVVAKVEGLSLGCVNRGQWRALVEGLRREVADAPAAPAARPDTSELLPGQGEIVGRAQAEFGRLRVQTGVEVYREVTPESDRLSTAYVLRAFERLGWGWHVGERFSLASMARRLGVVEAYERLLGRLLEMLEEDGALARDGAEWETLRRPESPEPRALFEEMLVRYPACEVELRLLGRCAGHLDEILRGECEPLQLLFTPAPEVNLERVYQEAPAARLVNGLVKEVTTAAVELWPAGWTLRALEIGAGTGSTTSLLLPCLPVGRTEYIFTDISQLFLINAQRKFRQHGFVSYELLDIERAPAAQGFAGRWFDLVVAANVLHATSDIRRTLRHVRQLMAPGGLLVLTEGIGRQRAADLMFGLLKGWWNFTDRELRRDHPLLSPGLWLGVLEEEGFDGAAALPAVGSEDEQYFQQALILARATKGGAEAGSVAASAAVEPPLLQQDFEAGGDVYTR